MTMTSEGPRGDAAGTLHRPRVGGTYTFVNWSDFARQGKHYIERIRAGESFVVLLYGEIIATMEPAAPGAYVVEMSKEGAST